MTLSKIEGQYRLSNQLIAESHLNRASNQAKQAFVLSLLEQDDITLEEAQQLLGIGQGELIQLLSEGFRFENIPILGLSQTDQAYVNRQALLFDKMYPSLLENYSGQWVLFEDDQVLDADSDYTILLQRIRNQGKRLFLIKKVCPLETFPLVDVSNSPQTSEP